MYSVLDSTLLHIKHYCVILYLCTKSINAHQIYREKIFRKLKLSPNKRLFNAKLLGETSIMFPINSYKSSTKIKSEINSIKKILNKYL